MSEAIGKDRLQKSDKRPPLSQAMHKVLKQQNVISRTRALRRVNRLLQNAIPDEAIDLISLFHFRVDELTEAGIPYEMVRALEKRYPFLLPE